MVELRRPTGVQQVTVREELGDLHQRVFALQVMITALIDAHPAPSQLDARLTALLEALSVHELGPVTLREISMARAQLRRKLGN